MWLVLAIVMIAACGGGEQQPPNIDGPPPPHSDAKAVDANPVACNLPASLGTLVDDGSATASITSVNGFERVTRTGNLSVPAHTTLLFIDVAAGGSEFPTVLAPKSNIDLATNPNQSRVHVIIFTDMGKSTSQDFGAVSGTLNITQVQPRFVGSLANVVLPHAADASQPVSLGDGCGTTITSLTFDTPEQ